MAVCFEGQSLAQWIEEATKTYTGDEQKKYDQAISLLTKVLKNVVEHPKEAKFRRIKMKPVEARLRIVPGALQVLRSVGFELHDAFLKLPDTFDATLVTNALNYVELRLAALASPIPVPIPEAETKEVASEPEVKSMKEVASEPEVESKESPQSSSGQPCEVSFIVTGFGAFAGVQNNPTRTTVEALKASVQTCPLASAPPVKVKLAEALVLETSAQMCVAVLQSLFEPEAKRFSCSHKPEDKCGCSERKRVWVHLGVDSRSKRFRVECAAFNEANFRVPDEYGWQPLDECVIKGDHDFGHGPFKSVLPPEQLKLGARLNTRVNVSGVVNALQAQRFPVDVGTDPGRFVCNYLYCHSLAACAGSPLERCVFVHVPPFTAVSKEDQAKFLRALLAVLPHHLD